ncbi:CBL-interacting protein kinase 18-like [Solanum stenotomum]|uniref:CBL-interacting protein kinase 18-like n=1 Tax=Solanum stenotomum TaxID=172797 RepID=UPI0020D0ACBF|nr:CBL-interacting protein kinase 18-like [Solanum stenotomum]XP_049409266.1 CBL-interacting protein kinase 18-like [Solanum stenotomum]XP_049409267.1 CBL-interacting protein kinase 18-like [Solanum stenotomum]XP_049409268.1 CBL-interacting protein kinase 18-like [Solanum stenotomum]
MVKNGNALMQKYELGRLLGQGNFGKVYYGKNLESGQTVAIKVIDKEKVQKAGLTEQTKREISVMALVKHPHVVQLYEVMATKSKIYFVIEHAKGGELFNTLTKGRLKEDVARKLFQQLINAVEFCHSRDVYHRDLKPENLLLDENGNLKVSDFGLSALAESKRQDGLLHTTCGTPAYVAPEVISRKGYKGVKADIWSCGVILFVLLAGYLPFYDSNLMNLYRKICRAEYKCPHWFPLEVRKLLSRILDPNPHKRISIAKIKESSWFKKGLGSTHVGTKQVVNQNVIADGDAVSSSNLESSTSSSDTKLELMKPAIFSAFHILCWFNLSGLFINNDQKEELRFTSVKPAPVIISKLVEVGRSLNLEIKKKEGGFLRLEGLNERRFETLCIDVQIFEISESHYYFIELSRSSGDAIDYQNMLTQTIRPALEEIVLAWQGVQSHQQ